MLTMPSKCRLAHLRFIAGNSPPQLEPCSSGPVATPQLVASCMPAGNHSSNKSESSSMLSGCSAGQVTSVRYGHNINFLMLTPAAGYLNTSDDMPALPSASSALTALA